jgi:hypothetical protein
MLQPGHRGPACGAFGKVAKHLRTLLFRPLIQDVFFLLPG